jgi:hypothetical protein
MHWRDHPPPHFHARYQHEEAVIDILGPGVRAGSLPPRQLGLVMEWAARRRPELLRAWESIRNGRSVEPIPGLE